MQVTQHLVISTSLSQGGDLSPTDGLYLPYLYKLPPELHSSKLVSLEFRCGIDGL